MTAFPIVPMLRGEASRRHNPEASRQTLPGWALEAFGEGEEPQAPRDGAGDGLI